MGTMNRSLMVPRVHFEKVPFEFKYRTKAPPDWGKHSDLPYRVFYPTFVRGYHGLVRDAVTGQLFAELRTDGTLIVYEGAPWDGPSGPAVDTPDFMDGSLAHDYLYRCIALGLVPRSQRKNADKTLAHINRHQGMRWFRNQYVYWGVRIGGGKHAVKDDGFMIGEL